MIRFSNLVAVGASTLWLTTSVNAALTPGGKVKLAVKSVIAAYEDCTNNQLIEAGQVFVNAAIIARWTSDDSLKRTTDSTTLTRKCACDHFCFRVLVKHDMLILGLPRRFSHYFTGENSTTVPAILTSILQNDDPRSALVQFKVSCKATADCSSGSSPSLAVTDALPGTATFTPMILLCPYFFDSTTARTMNNLYSKTLKKNPTQHDKSWCQPGAKFADFETAGHTAFHEMTHLDEFASKEHSNPLLSRPS